MMPSARDLFGAANKYIFQQDGAPCHTANARNARSGLLKIENTRFFTRTEIGTDSGRPEPVPVQR